MTNQELANYIEKTYGFKKELIQNIRSSGLGSVRFTVNGINYHGCTPYAGAQPMLWVESYAYTYYWRGTPVTEAYYKKFIEGRTIYLKKCIDADCGEWEWLDITFKTEAEALCFIRKFENPEMFDYDVKYE